VFYIQVKWSNQETRHKYYKAKIRICCSYLEPSHCQFVSMLEMVQRRCLKVGPLAQFDYPTRSSIVGLSTLKTRRTRGDLIQLFRYYKRFDALNLPNTPALGKSSTRGHRLKFITECCLYYSRKNFCLIESHQFGIAFLTL